MDHSITRTVNECLRHWAKTDPDRPAFVFRRSVPTSRRLAFSRSEAFVLGSRFAAILRRKGIKRGDIVCNTLSNTPERLLTDLGILLAGATSLNGQVLFKDGIDFYGLLRRAGCVAIIDHHKHPESAASLFEGRLQWTGKEDVYCPELPALRLFFRLGQDGERPFLDEVRSEEETFVDDVMPSDIAYVLTTSGSTGFSKLVPWTHEKTVLFGEQMYTAASMTPEEIYFNNESLGWVCGFPCVYSSYGITRVLLDCTDLQESEVDLNWTAINEEKCTVAFLLPPVINRLINASSAYKGLCTRLRMVITGGQVIQEHLLKCLGNICDGITIAYGITESGVVARKQIFEENKHEFDAFNNGLPLPGCEIRIVDKNMEDVVETGKVGEVLVRGGVVFSGYMAPENIHQHDVFTSDGWFRTSDIGFFNSRRELHVVCRKQNAIMYGAVIVYPEWLESRIARCPGVQGVVIVPVPDPIMYQNLCACIIPQPGADLTVEDLEEFCKKMFLTPEDAEVTAIPKYYLFFDAFPTTYTNKLDRKAIGAMALEKLGLTKTSSKMSETQELKSEVKNV